MDAPRISPPSPAFVVKCIDAFLEVMSGAETLALAGKVGAEFQETLRFASELLEIIGEGVESRPDATADGETLLRSLQATYGLVDPAGSLR